MLKNRTVSKKIFNFVSITHFPLIKNSHIAFFLLLLGLFSLPSLGYACAIAKEKTSCEKNIDAKDKKETQQQNCCSDDACSKKDQHHCNGKCDHSNCTTSSIQFSLLATNEFELYNHPFNFSLENPVPYYKNLSISDGFTSIWAPPKIT